MRGSYPRFYRAVKDAVGGWARETPNARDVFRRSGFKPTASDPGIPRPILSIEGSKRGCFDPDALFPWTESQWAIKGGRLYIWGTSLAGAYGLPDPSPSRFLIPTPHPSAITNAVGVASPADGPSVLLDDGTVLYKGTYRTETSSGPVALSGLSDVIQVHGHASAAPRSSYYFLKSDGTVWHMGEKGAGKIGRAHV